jgi:hypothetical protein
MNDDWVLEPFLKAVNLFSDHIILLDQNSDDSSHQIINKFKKVELFENPSSEYNEKERQNFLLEKARLHGSNHILISLDVDEVFSPNFYLPENIEWLKSLPSGTSLCFEWANIHWNRKEYWTKKMLPIVYVDDGQNNLDEREFHRPRVPISKTSTPVYIDKFKIIHLQYVDVQRFKMKHRWYQLYELTQSRHPNFVNIYRKYHHMFSIGNKNLEEIIFDWVNFLRKIGFDLALERNHTSGNWCRSDEIVKMQENLSPQARSKLDLDFNLETNHKSSKYVRSSRIDQLVLNYLSFSQKYYRHSSFIELMIFLPIKFFDLVIGRFWR